MKSILLNFNTLIFASTQILLFILFPFFSERFSLSHSTIISSFTFGSALFLWGAPFWTAKSDKIGKQKVMNFGLSGLVISFALLTLLIFYSNALGTKWTLIILVLSRLIYGLMASAIVPVAQAMRSEVSGANQLKGMFSHSFMLNLGRTLGPVLLILLTNIPLLFCTLSLLTFVLLILNLKLENTITISEQPKVEHNLKRSLLEMRLPLLLTILFTTFTGILHSSLGGTLQMALHMDAVSASKLMAQVLLLGSFTMMVIQFIGKNLDSKRWSMSLIIGILALFAGTIILTNLNDVVQIWPAIILISAGIALIQPSNLTLLHLSQKEFGLGKKIGLLASGNTIGYAIGGTLTSIFIAHHINLIAVMIVCALFGVALISRQRYQNAHL